MLSLGRFASLAFILIILCASGFGIFASQAIGQQRTPATGSRENLPVSPPPSGAVPSTQPASQGSPDVQQLQRRIDAFERTIEQMQRMDSRISAIAPWISLTISCVGLFPLLLIAYEWSIRRSNEKKFDDFKAENRTEIDRLMKACQAEVNKTTDERLRDQLSYLITSELRRVTQKIESDYGGDLAHVDGVCYSVIQNEFIAKCNADGVFRGVEYLHIFRHLLLLLVAGDGHAKQTALHRLRNEFVTNCGPTTRSLLGVLLERFERDARFSRQELAAPLSDLKSCCTI